MPSPAASNTACWLRSAMLSSRSRCFNPVMSLQIPVTDSISPASFSIGNALMLTYSGSARLVALYRLHVEHRPAVHHRREAPQKLAAREFRRVEVPDVAAEHLARLVAVQITARAIRHKRQARISVANPDQRGRRLDQRAITAFAFRQLVLRGAVLGVIDDRKHESCRAAVAAAHRSRRAESPRRSCRRRAAFGILRATQRRDRCGGGARCVRGRDRPDAVTP